MAKIFGENVCLSKPSTQHNEDHISSSQFSRVRWFVSVLQKLSHVLVDLVGSILLYPVTAVRDVSGGRGGEREEEGGKGEKQHHYIVVMS